jgi:hypothetical protein
MSSKDNLDNQWLGNLAGKAQNWQNFGQNLSSGLGNGLMAWAYGGGAGAGGTKPVGFTGG